MLYYSRRVWFWAESAWIVFSEVSYSRLRDSPDASHSARIRRRRCQVAPDRPGSIIEYESFTTDRCLASFVPGGPCASGNADGVRVDDTSGGDERRAVAKAFRRCDSGQTNRTQKADEAKHEPQPSLTASVVIVSHAPSVRLLSRFAGRKEQSRTFDALTGKSR